MNSIIQLLTSKPETILLQIEKLENFMDTVDAVGQLNQMVPLNVEAIGELTDIDEFEDKMDPDLERQVGQPGLKMRDSNGQEFSLEN